MTLKYKILLPVILLFTGFSLFTSGQSLRVTRFAEEEGLPSGLVKSVVRDKQGIIWAATDDGLIRFDGREFKLFHDELPGIYAKSVFLLDNGDLLVTTDMGISRLSFADGKLKFSTIAKGSVHESDTTMWFPKMIYRDARKRIWVSDNYRIYQFINDKFRFYNPGPEAATNNYLRSFSFADDGYGNLFAVSETGYVYYYNEKRDVFEPAKMNAHFTGVNAVLNISRGVLLVATRDGLFEMKTGPGGQVQKPVNVSLLEVSDMAVSQNGTVYAGTWAEGLYIVTFDRQGKYRFTPVSQYAEKDAGHIFVDSDDNIWIASDIGILLLQQTLFGSPFSDLTGAYIQNISKNRKGEIYFTDGSGVFKTEAGRGLSASRLFSNNSIVLQIVTDKDKLWLSDADGFISHVSATTGAILEKFDFSMTGKAVFKLVKGHDGSIWACQDANEKLIRIYPDKSIKMYGYEEGLKSRSISLTLSGSGELYSGGMKDSAYLSVYNPYIDKFINLSERLDFERNIDINVNDLVCAPKSNDIWLGTSFGLIRLHKGEFVRVDLGIYTENSIKALAIDSLGYVWLANNKGLHRYRDGDLMSFDDKTGLPSKTIAYRGLLVDVNNRLWVGTLAGVAVSSQLTIPKKTLSPTLRATMIDNQQADLPDSENFSFSNKSFINLNLASPEFPTKQLIYERWIEGLDSAWIPIPNDGNIILGGMKPGDYVLKVRSRQRGNYVFSDPYLLSFKVTRIWYERWWVIGLIFIVLLTGFRISTRAHSRRLRIDNEKLEQIITERTQEIVKQRDQIEEQNTRISSKNEDLSLKNKELELAKNQAEEAAKAKSQFLSVMSHEIRTPMNAVIGITHLLMRDNPRPEQLEDLKILKFSAENLLGLINDVLDLNKIEAGKLVIESIDFNLKNLAEGVQSSMSLKAREKQIELNFEYDEKLPLYLVSDPLRIAQILNNLVSNAIKFTDRGGVMVEIKQAGRKVDKIDVEFIVSDTGIGIPAEKHQQIFGAFNQASTETSRKYGGTGLGLAITSKLLEMLGSEIRLKSEPGEGSAFSFIITMLEGSTRMAAQAEAGADEMLTYKFNGQRVLLVEDNKINELIARKFMEEWNLKVDSAANGLEAIEKLDQENYRLILMDLQMPEMDGYKTATIIRSRGAEPYISIPIIALTASSKSEVQEKINRAGMNDFVSKPFNPPELFSKLRTFLELR